MGEPLVRPFLRVGRWLVRWWRPQHEGLYRWAWDGEHDGGQLIDPTRPQPIWQTHDAIGVRPDGRTVWRRKPRVKTPGEVRAEQLARLEAGRSDGAIVEYKTGPGGRRWPVYFRPHGWRVP